MAQRNTGRFGTALALLSALGVALVVGGTLVITCPFAPEVTQAVPVANRQSARPAVTPVATVATPPAATATANVLVSVRPAVSASASEMPVQPPTQTIASTTQPRTPPPSPSAWAVIGRWQADQLIITEPFTTHGPWRLCWSQPDAQISFQVMVGNPEQTAWDLLSAPTGATTGAFDFPQSGSYRLMFHSESRYVALVVARSSDIPAEPPPCG